VAAAPLGLHAKAVEYTRRAGEVATGQLAFEEAARHYEIALTLVSGELERCELLLALGEARARAGDGPEAKRAFREAADLAERGGSPQLLARAALGYGGRFAWARASTDPAFLPLLERAAEAIDDPASPERLRLLARIAAASRDDRARDQRVTLAEETLGIARRHGDPETLAAVLEGHSAAVEGPDHHLRRTGIALSAELIALGERIGDKERVFAGHDYRLHCLWAIGDRAGIDVDIAAMSAVADELRQPAHHWHVGAASTVLALMEGRFERAEELIAETRALGERAEHWNAGVSQRLALFVLYRAQGRLGELESTMRRSVHEYPALLRFRCAAVHLYGELGREGDCSAELEALLSGDLAHEHVDSEWLFSVSLLADPCASFGTEDASTRLYSLLLPYERLYAEAPIEAVFGSVARGLGVLATALGRFDEAERHFDVAIEVEERMLAPPWLAHSRHGLATMLLARDAAGDRDRATALLDEVVHAYRQLGMETWAARAEAQRSSRPRST
jgi:tetratricopeptide (TPR) repeat protein